MQGIRTHGPDLSMEDMAESAGVSKPVIYATFGGRSGVAEHLAAELGERIERAVIEGLADGADEHAAVRVLMELLLDLVSEEPEIYAFMVRALRSSGGGLLDNALVNAVSIRVARLWEVVGVQLDPDVQRVGTHALVGLVFATLDSWQMTRRPPREDVVDVLAMLVARAIDMIRSGEVDLGAIGRR